METKSVQRVNQDTFEQEVLKSEIPAVVDFYADWCGPCRLVSPIIESLSKEYNGKVRFFKVNTDENQELAVKYDIMSIPTVMIFREGKTVERLIGAAPAQTYRHKIDAALSHS